MRINFDTILTNLNGTPLKNERKEDVTLKSASIEALMVSVEGEPNDSGEQKLKRYEVAAKVNSGGEVEVTPEEASLIKTRIGIAYGPAVVGPAFKLLNG